MPCLYFLTVFIHPDDSWCKHLQLSTWIFLWPRVCDWVMPVGMGQEVLGTSHPHDTHLTYYGQELCYINIPFHCPSGGTALKWDKYRGLQHNWAIATHCINLLMYTQRCISIFLSYCHIYYCCLPPNNTYQMHTYQINYLYSNPVSDINNLSKKMCLQFFLCAIICVQGLVRVHVSAYPE